MRVLLVEDDDADAELLERTLRSGGMAFELVRASDAESCARGLDAQPDVVITDYMLPGFSAEAVLESVRGSGRDIPLLVVTGAVGEEVAVGLMRAGAADCLLKGALSRLVPAIQRELREAEGRRRQRAADERARKYAWLDPETGLANRNRLVDELELRLANGTRFRLALLTIERYHDVLRTLGHRVVDEMVLGVASRLGACAEEFGCFVARAAGSEFAIVADRANEGANAEFLAVIAAAAEHTGRFGDLALDVRVRVGSALGPEDGDGAMDLLRRARVALDHAIRSGQRASVYAKAIDPWSPRRLELMNDLEHATKGHNLFLMYQPRVALPDQRLLGAEALLRWNHPRYGLVPPDEFIPLAEHTGQILSLTEWVLEAAATQAAAWRADGDEIPVGVNVSARSLTETDLPATVRAVLRRHRLLPSALELEVTEGVLMTDPVRARAALAELGLMGVKVFLDDFGAGYSSLAYLKRLPLHALKIDRAFVTGGLVDHGDLSIVNSTISLAHSLGLRVVAEGVESAATLERLSALRCDEAQGYFLSRPLLPAKLVEWHRGRPRESMLVTG